MEATVRPDLSFHRIANGWLPRPRVARLHRLQLTGKASVRKHPVNPASAVTDLLPASRTISV